MKTARRITLLVGCCRMKSTIGGDMTKETEAKVTNTLRELEQQDLVSLVVDLINSLPNNFHGDVQDRALEMIWNINE